MVQTRRIAHSELLYLIPVCHSFGQWPNSSRRAKERDIWPNDTETKTEKIEWQFRIEIVWFKQLAEKDVRRRLKDTSERRLKGYQLD